MSGCPKPRASLAQLEDQDRPTGAAPSSFARMRAPRDLLSSAPAGSIPASCSAMAAARSCASIFRATSWACLLLAFADLPETVTAARMSVLWARSAASGSPLRRSSIRGSGPHPGVRVAERVALADRLASIGRTSARARVGSLICEIVARMRAVGAVERARLHPAPAHPGGYRRRHGPDLGPRQPDDARSGRRQIIERNGGSHVRLLDEKRLIAEFELYRPLRAGTGWLPPAR